MRNIIKQEGKVLNAGSILMEFVIRWHCAIICMVKSNQSFPGFFLFRPGMWGHEDK